MSEQVRLGAERVHDLIDAAMSDPLFLGVLAYAAKGWAARDLVDPDVRSERRRGINYEVYNLFLAISDQDEVAATGLLRGFTLGIHSVLNEAAGDGGAPAPGRLN